MDWTLVFACIVLAALAVSAVPLFRPGRPWDIERASRLDELLASKARVLRSIKDLDHEKEAGLLSEEDWRETREEYVEEAVRLNRLIESPDGLPPGKSL